MSQNENDKVLVGKQDWLFLKSDVNRSADQFLGTFLLDDVGILAYEKYFQELKSKVDANLSYLVVPNKEYVKPEFYPHELLDKNIVRIVNQVESVAKQFDINFIYPIEELKKVESFYKVDTHWNDIGAWAGLQSTLKSLGEDFPESLFQHYHTINVSGDLGSKLDPIQRDNRHLFSDEFQFEVLFDSGLKNHGHITHLRNNSSVLNKKIVIFGDSFGISFIKPISVIYREVVFVYSPGIINKEIVDLFLPDDIVLQVNQRFLAEPPVFRTSIIKSSIFKKIIKMSPEEMKSYVGDLVQYNTSSPVAASFISSVNSILQKGG